MRSTRRVAFASASSAQKWATLTMPAPRQLEARREVAPVDVLGDGDL